MVFVRHFLLRAVGVENSFMLKNISIVVFTVNVKWGLAEGVNLSVLCYSIYLLWPLQTALDSSSSMKQLQPRALQAQGSREPKVRGCPALIAKGACSAW